MNILKNIEGNKLEMAVEGRLDTNSSPVFMDAFTEVSEGIEDFVLDLGKVDYISSAGLRVLLSMQKIMNKQGKMTIVNATSDLMEVFDLTGFSDILNIG
ncbi:MAG: STAS domain-containing protein [Lachnospiraceae bacterium]|nr:STAS domain-containing protein [Lachnospiraceae bacterium]